MPLYKATDRMSRLVGDNLDLLQMLYHFRIPLGFSDRTVAEVCEAHSIDTVTFLAIASITLHGQHTASTPLHIPTLLRYAQCSHDFFLNYAVPANRQKLEAALMAEDKLRTLILSVYDQYAEEVKTHMNYEDDDVFIYVNRLVEGQVLEDDYTIQNYAQQHDEASDRLSELKNLLIRFYPGSDNNMRLLEALHAIYQSARWLELHCRIEDILLLPAILRLERQLRTSQATPQPHGQKAGLCHTMRTTHPKLTPRS